MTLGQRISQHRKKLGISQEILGERLGVSRQAVSKWETDVALPDMENLLALAREFNISVAELTGTPEDTLSGIPKKRTRLFSFCSALLAIIFIAFIARIVSFYTNPPTADHLSKPSASTPDSTLSEQTTSTSPIVVPAPEPESDFALLWFNTDGQEEFLELGAQDNFFPFGTSLELTAPKEILDTDFHLTDLHQTVCGAINLDYLHAEEDPELDPDSFTRESILRLSTIAPSVRTPKGIHVGSTKAQVTEAYGDKLVYCLKETDSYTLVPHDYYYVYQTDLAFSKYLAIYMKDGLVVGLKTEDLIDAGNMFFDPNNINIFPLKDGEPDFSLREEPEQEQISNTRKVYIAWNQLMTNNNLSAEEQYAYRRDIFGLLPYMDWGELCALGNTEQPDDTLFGLMNWLSNQDTYSSSEILWIQMGCTAKGIDGAYTEAYGLLLYRVFSYDPISFIKSLATDGIDETTKWHATLSTAFNAVWHERECTQIIETLEAALSNGIFNEPQSDWCRLMLLYLRTPEDEMGTLPRSPADMP